MALPVYKFILGSQVRHHLIIHGGSRDHCMTDLEQYGLKAKNLSRIIGGSFDDSNLMPLLMDLESVSSAEYAVENLTYS